MTMPRVDGYAPKNTCRSCEYLGQGNGNYGMGCDRGDVRVSEENFPYVQGCQHWSDWYASTVKNMAAIAAMFTDNPNQAVASFLLASMDGKGEVKP